MRVRAALAILTAAALAVVATACGGSRADKAGGKPEGKPIVLTLESEDDPTLSGAPEFADAVRQLSHGSLLIELVPAGRGTEVDFERGVVEDVRGGKAQLGIVGVRVWDTMGVASFRALLAPLLIDSFELEQRVLSSPLAESMLDGVEKAGLVGVALLPGPLRRPLGLPRALVGPEDYRGATIGIRPGGVMRAALRALGGAARSYVPGSLSGLDGVEVDPKTIAYNGWDRQAGALTTNVVLWPKPYSIVMNRKAFEALASEQQEILRNAGREALAPELAQTRRDEAAALSGACKRGRLSFATASASELAALRAAVQPVYDELQRDPETRKLIAAIENVRGSGRAAAPPPGCREAVGRNEKHEASALEGRWRMTWTRDELIAVGIPEKILLKDLPQKGSVVYEFAAGRFRVIIPDGRFVGRGRYSVEGDILNFVYEAPTLPGYVAGHVYRHRWSVYHDSLTFARFPGSDADLVLLVKPLSRVR